MPRKRQYKLCSRESGEPTWFSRVQNDFEEHYKTCVHGGNITTRRQTCAHRLAYTVSIRCTRGNGRTHGNIIIELCRQPPATYMKPKTLVETSCILKRKKTHRWLRNMLCHVRVQDTCRRLAVHDWHWKTAKVYQTDNICSELLKSSLNSGLLSWLKF